ncbi:MAG TPA: YihY/virulence factor BrkB family protein [Casimicrobiaceae bacterium]|nr:YihY/virulence factor BrkB family protein [Casimicrobiaceae bacterium]
MTVNDLWSVIKAAVSGWVDDYAQSMGAALAYYTMFSIAPLLLIVISIAGVVFGDEASRGEIFIQLEGMLGAPGALAVQGLLESVREPSESVTATVFGVALLLIGATSVFVELQDALDRIWRAPVRAGRSGLWALIRARLLSFGLILGIGFLLMVSLVASAALAALQKWWGPVFGDWAVVAGIAEVALSFLMFTVVFAMVYKIVPRVRIHWKDVWIGAATTSLLFTVGKVFIAIYIGRSGIASGFGVAASLIVVLVWVYYSAQILLLGAEFTCAYAHKFGSRRNLPSEDASAAVSRAAPSPNVNKDISQ